MSADNPFKSLDRRLASTPWVVDRSQSENGTNVWSTFLDPAVTRSTAARAAFDAVPEAAWTESRTATTVALGFLTI